QLRAGLAVTHVDAGSGGAVDPGREARHVVLRDVVRDILGDGARDVPGVVEAQVERRVIESREKRVRLSPGTELQLECRAQPHGPAQLRPAEVDLPAESGFERETHQDGVVTLEAGLDRKSTRLNSSHVKISYAVFCLKKKINTKQFDQVVGSTIVIWEHN